MGRRFDGTGALAIVPDAPPPDKHSLLLEAEREFEGGLMAAARALRRIQVEKLYEGEYARFGDYCKYRWHIGLRYAQRQIAAANIADNVRPIGHIPTTEWQIRPLAALRTPQEQQAAWAQVVETAPLDAESQPIITQAHVESVVKGITGKPSLAVVAGTADHAANSPSVVAGRAIQNAIKKCQTALYALEELKKTGHIEFCTRIHRERFGYFRRGFDGFLSEVTDAND